MMTSKNPFILLPYTTSCKLFMILFLSSLFLFSSSYFVLIVAYLRFRIFVFVQTKLAELEWSSGKVVIDFVFLRLLA